MLMDISADSIGVVVPTCGIHDFLWETLDSLDRARLKTPPGEIIVCVNAGSNSESIAKIIRERVGAWAKVIISDPVRQLPIYENWNFCVSQISLPYVHMLHDDDTIFPYFYDAMSDLMIKYPGGALYTSNALTFGDSFGYSAGPVVEGPWENASGVLKRANCLLVSAVVFKKELFVSFDESLTFVADWKAWHDLANGGQVFCTRQALINCRLHAQSAGSSVMKSIGPVYEIRHILELFSEGSSKVDYSFAAAVAFGSADNALVRKEWISAFRIFILGLKCHFSPKAVFHFSHRLFKITFGAGTLLSSK